MRDIDWFLIGFGTPIKWMINGDSVDFCCEIHLFYYVRTSRIVDGKLRYLNYTEVARNSFNSTLKTDFFGPRV